MFLSQCVIHYNRQWWHAEVDQGVSACLGVCTHASVNVICINRHACLQLRRPCGIHSLWEKTCVSVCMLETDWERVCVSVWVCECDCLWERNKKKERWRERGEEPFTIQCRQVEPQFVVHLMSAPNSNSCTYAWVGPSAWSESENSKSSTDSPSRRSVAADHSCKARETWSTAAFWPYMQALWMGCMPVSWVLRSKRKIWSATQSSKQVS